DDAAWPLPPTDLGLLEPPQIPPRQRAAAGHRPGDRASVSPLPRVRGPGLLAHADRGLAGAGRLASSLARLLLGRAAGLSYRILCLALDLLRRSPGFGAGATGRDPRLALDATLRLLRLTSC